MAKQHMTDTYKKLFAVPTAIVVAVSSMILGCSGSQNLGRKEATQLLASSDEIGKWAQSVHLHQSGRELAILLDLVTSQHKYTTIGDETFSGTWPNSATWRVAVRPEVDVESIGPVNDSSEFRAIEFTVRQSNLPLLGKAISVVGATGTALASRWDDGWRIANIELNPLPKLIELTSDESTSIASRLSDVRNARKQRIDLAAKKMAQCTEDTTGQTADIDFTLAATGDRAYSDSRRAFLNSVAIFNPTVVNELQFGRNGLRAFGKPDDKPTSVSHFVAFREILSLETTRNIPRGNANYRRLGLNSSVILSGARFNLLTPSDSSSERLKDEIEERLQNWRRECVPALREFDFVSSEKQYWGELE